MLAWAMTFPVIALIAPAPGSGGIAGASADSQKGSSWIWHRNPPSKPK
jgi:hypothetical protein